MDFDIRRLALETAQRLVDHHARVRQAVALALGARGQQERAHAGRLADAQRGHVRLDELHGVVDRQAGRNRTAGRVDVEVDVLVGVFRLQEQHLRDHQVGRRVVHRTDQEDDPFLEQARVDVVGAFATAALLDDHGHQPQTLGLEGLRIGNIAFKINAHQARPISSSKEVVTSSTWA